MKRTVVMLRPSELNRSASLNLKTREGPNKQMKRPATVVGLLFGMFLLSSTFPKAICVAQSQANPNSFELYVGIYKLKTNDFVSIANFDLGDGQNRMLFTDFKSGIVRILSPSSQDSFTGGTGLLLTHTVEIQVSFV